MKGMGLWEKKVLYVVETEEIEWSKTIKNQQALVKHSTVCEHSQILI